MADAAPRKGGWLAMLGLRPRSKEPDARRRLSKKKSAVELASPDPDKLADSASSGRSSTDSAGKPSPASPPQPPPTRAPRAPTQPRHVLDKDTGERRDLTEMLHALTYREDLDAIDEVHHHSDSLEYDPSKPDGTAMLASLSPELWLHVAEYLSALDVARLSSTCRTMTARLGPLPYRLLRDPSNHSDRLDFLLAMDAKLPRHLFCFPCAQWHLRIQPGFESLKPQSVLNPLFECPNRKNFKLPPPRIRITEGRTLPFTFVQLAKRHWALGPEYGIPHQSLARRWREPSSSSGSGWAHSSLYHVTDRGHVLVRVTSQVFVAGGLPDAAKRGLLFSRDDYTPYFSVCAHWKAGELTAVPKCALDHLPVEDASARRDLQNRLHGGPPRPPAAGLVPTCNRCKPIRRCPRCPTEYLFELKTAEDRSVAANGPGRFKPALFVSRWSDLGPARRPDDKEWAAVAGLDAAGGGYDSFAEMGQRSLNGTFEAAFTDTVPGRRIVSTNPKNVGEDERGGSWF